MHWIATGWGFNAAVLMLALLVRVAERWKERRRHELPPKPETPQLDLEDPLIRAALREVDALAWNMPIAPPRDERDWTDAERTAMASERSRLLSVLLAKRAAVIAESAHTRVWAIAGWLANRWSANSTRDAAGNVTLPDLTVVSGAEISFLGWQEVIADHFTHNPEALAKAIIVWDVPPRLLELI